LDAETGLYHYRARTYDPAEGRFKQRDPLGHSDGMNPYQHVGSGPTDFTDPSGLWKEDQHYAITKEAAEESINLFKAGSRALGELLVGHEKEIVTFLQESNMRVDTRQPSILELHYNRPIGARTRREKERWDTAYGEALKTRIDDFDNRLPKANSRKDCFDVLEVLGSLSHSWQDFFAHAIGRAPPRQAPTARELKAQIRSGTANRANFFVYSSGAMLADISPVSRGAVWPSSYVETGRVTGVIGATGHYVHVFFHAIIPFTSTGEHPDLAEPVVEGSVEGQARRRKALIWTSQMYWIHNGGYLNRWLQKCACFLGRR
jgi:hypothetical protein